MIEFFSKSMAVLKFIVLLMLSVTTPLLLLTADLEAAVSETKELPADQYPTANKGLLRIDSDGAYIYKTDDTEHGESIGLSALSMDAPDILGPENTTTDFGNMYGEDRQAGPRFTYDYQLATPWGPAGVQAGIGLISLRGPGRFVRDGSISEEEFTLFIVPLSLMGVYRIQASDHPWVAPYLTAGAFYFGMAETKSDGGFKAAGAFSAAAGGGLLISLTNWNQMARFTLRADYGVDDMWLNIGVIAMKGLKSEADFTNISAIAGVVFDY